MTNVLIHVLMILLFHPLHLAVVHIYESGEKNQWHISVRVFNDDLEMAVNKKIEHGITLNGCIDQEQHNNFLYLMSNLKVIQGQSRKKIKPQGYKIDNDVTTFEFITSINANRKLEIRCDLFMEIYHDQTNLIIIKGGGIEEGYKINRFNQSIHVEFK